MFLVTGRLKLFTYDSVTLEYKSEKPNNFTRLIEASNFNEAEIKLKNWFSEQSNENVIVRPVDYTISDPIR